MRKRTIQNFDIGNKHALSIPEAAWYTGLGTRAVRKYLDEIGATIKYGRRVLADRNKIDADMDKRAGKENE